MKTNNSLKGCVALFLTAGIWGSAFLFQKLCANYPFQTNCLRFLLGAIFLLIIYFVYSFIKRKKLNPITKEEKKKSFIGGVICGITLSLATTLQQLGLTFGTTAGKSGFLTALYIVIIPIIGLIFGKKQQFKTWALAILAFFGAFLMSFSSKEAFLIGDLLTIFCAIVFAVNVITVGKFSKGADAILFSFYQCLFSGLISLIFLAFGVGLKFEELSASTLSEIIFSVLYVAVMSSGIAYTLQIVGQKYTSPESASIIMSLESVFSVIFGVIFLKETVSLTCFFGIICILTSSILTQIDFGKIRNGKN